MVAEKTNRVWDFLVLWPAIYIVLMIISIPLLIIAGNGSNPEDLMLGSALYGMFMTVGYFATIVIYVYSIHRLYTQTKLPNDQKKTWLILVILFNMITIPILHFMHLRK